MAIIYIPNTDEAFEDMYAAVREKEGRVYTDKQVAHLPDINAKHIHAGEWKMRKLSSQRLINYLTEKKQPLNILEIGCGNGWLSAKLADITHAMVTGLDASRLEIDQANRVFNKPNLKFIDGSFNKDMFVNEWFDVIIFAAALSYFPSVKTVLTDAFALLKPKGKVHVLDTPFYNKNNIDTAIERCEEYYYAMGYPLMANNYYHHSLGKIMGFTHKILHDPVNIWNRLRKQGTFYWIMLKP